MESGILGFRRIVFLKVIDYEVYIILIIFIFSFMFKRIEVIYLFIWKLYIIYSGSVYSS